MKYLFVFLLLGLMVSCGDDDKRLDCEDVEGIEDLTKYGEPTIIPSNYTGVVKACIDSIGKVGVLRHYKNGEIGRLERFNSRGIIEYLEVYENGVIQFVKSFAYNGQLTIHCIYKNGRPFCQEVFDFPSGKRIKNYGDWEECGGWTAEDAEDMDKSPDEVEELIRQSQINHE